MTNYNANNTGRFVNLFIEFCEERNGRSLVAEATEMIKVDTSSVADEFMWLQEKGVELNTVDKEDRMYAYGEFQQWAKETAEKEGGWIEYNLGDVCRWAKAQYIEATQELDINLANSNAWKTEEMELFEDKRPHARILNYLQHMAMLMSKKQLIKSKKRLFELRGKGPDTKNRMSYDLYVKCMIIVLTELLERFDTDERLLCKFTEMEFAMNSVHGEAFRVDVADCMLNVEAAIDYKRDAERLAARHNLSIQEAFIMLQANDEGIEYDFNADIAEAFIVEDDEYEEYVD